MPRFRHRTLSTSPCSAVSRTPTKCDKGSGISIQKINATEIP
jgi:hypothetical protein